MDPIRHLEVEEEEEEVFKKSGTETIWVPEKRAQAVASGHRMFLFR